MKTKEVKLAEEGTIMAKFQKEKTDAISEMFDNKYEDGIYPTSKFFIRLDNALLKALSQQKQEMVEEIDKRVIVLKELIEKFDYDIDKNRLDELNQLKQNLTK